jgi:hypothetical protein
MNKEVDFSTSDHLDLTKLTNIQNQQTFVTLSSFFIVMESMSNGGLSMAKMPLLGK